MKNKRLLRSFAAVLSCAVMMGYAAEPLCWERTPNRPAPAQFDTFHGQSLDFRCTFTGFGALPFSGSGAVAPRLYYQTNGMAAAWWSIPATVSYTVVTNCPQLPTNQPTNQHTNYQLSATFPPSADPGAERLTVFFGAPSNAYAAAQVRFRNSPGAHPNDLDPPSVLDWQAELAAATNDLFKSFAPITNTYTKAETDARIAELAPRTSLEPATNYTDLATNALRKSLSIITTNDVRAIVTATGNWEWTGPGTYIASASELPAEGSVEGETYFTVSDIGWVDATPGSEYWDAFMTTWQWGEEAGGWGWLEAGDVGHDHVHGEDTDVIEFYVLDYIFIGRKYNALGLARLSDLAAATNSLHKSFAPTISNTVTRTYVEGLGIESGITASTATNIAQSALGEFANTGTVYNAENANNAIDAQSSIYANTAYSLEGTDGIRTADQIFSVVDESASTNYANTAAYNAVANADTTYRRSIGLTNLNQSVQYVNITDPTPTTLAISMPTNGVTKDWIVYVSSVTNVSLSLPSATWWMADVAYTNDVPPTTPTAFYFSQIAEGIFYLGRQELTEVTAP